jgi:lipopolysaccharide transport system permease protein
MQRIRQWGLAPFKHYSLLRGFLRQDIHGRFAGSMGGLFWSVLTPLAHILIYLFVFSTIMKIRLQIEEVGTDRFAVYMLSGLLPWMAFAEALGRAPGLLLEKANLITKVSFPVEILPYVNTSTPFLLNGIGFGLFLLWLLFLGYFDPAWLLLPLVVFCHFLFTLGLVALLSALSVFLRDLQHVIALAVTVWFFMTPIIYPLSMVPQELHIWMQLNPMYPFIELYRQVLLQHSLPLDLLAAAAALGLAVYSAGGWFFMRIKHAFGDVL